MPKYDVKCEECGWEDEIEHSMHDNHPPCECSGKLKTIFKSSQPIRFRGEGWTPKFRNKKQQQDYSKGRMNERKQSLRNKESIHGMDEHND